MSNKSLTKRTDRRRLGWFAALGMLCFLVSSPAWALDLDLVAAQQNADSQQILSTLGHSRPRAVAGDSSRHKSNVHLTLVKARKHKKHA